VKDRPWPPPAVVLPVDNQPERRYVVLHDGYETSVYIHRPDDSKEVSGTVLFLHGIQSHPAWYFGTSRFLADNGFTVYQVTRRGCGDNTVSRGDAPSSNALLEDINTAVSFCLSDSGMDNIHLLGVSWGGKLLTAYMTWEGRTHRPLSLTLLSPGISAIVSPPFLIKCGVALSMLTGGEKKFPIPLSDSSLFTDNPQMQEYIDNDSYSLRDATARFLFISRLLDKRIGRSPRKSIDVPVNLILSSKDKIINNSSCERVCRRLTKDGNLHIAVLDGAHTLEFEDNPEGFYRAVLESVMRG